MLSTWRTPKIPGLAGGGGWGAPLVAPGTFSKISSLALTFLVEKVQIPLSFVLFVTNSDMRIHRVFQKGSETEELLQP